MQKIRHERGLSIETLMGLTGYGDNTLSRLEQGESVRLITLVDVAKALGVTLADIAQRAGV